MNGFLLSNSNNVSSSVHDVLSDPDAFMRELNKPSVTVETLKEHRVRVQAEADEVNFALKRNVYKNYALFINSAKEISLLKTEMYSLSRLLNEQQTLLESLTDLSVSGDRSHSLTLNEKKEVTIKEEEAEEELEDVSESELEMIPPWLQECPDDMDVLIAQRNFEDAVSLVVKVNDHLVLYPKCYEVFMQNDLKARVNKEIQELINCISNELQASPDRSLQSGPRSARRAVQLLLRLGKASLACRLFLNQRSSILHFSLKQQQMTEGSQLRSIKRLASIFFNNIIEACREFEKAFKTMSGMSSGYPTSGDGASSQPTSLNERDCIVNGSDIRSPTSLFPPAFPMACLVLWVQKELNSFMDTFNKTIIISSLPPSSTSEAVAVVKNQADRLKNAIGLDVSFHIDKCLPR